MKNLTAIKKAENAIKNEKVSREKRIKELDGRLAKTRKGYDFVFDILPTLKQLGFWVDNESRHTPFGDWSY